MACIPAMTDSNGNIIIMKGRQTGPATNPIGHWLQTFFHTVKGFELLDQMDLSNYEQLAKVFQSSATDWEAGFSSSKKSKMNPLSRTKKGKRKASQYHDGTYLRVYSPNFTSRIVMFISEKGNKIFLKEMRRDLGLHRDTYFRISFEDILTMVTPEEQDNLVYFLDHA
jgi:hypothetical protein